MIIICCLERDQKKRKTESKSYAEDNNNVDKRVKEEVNSVNKKQSSLRKRQQVFD